MFNCSEADVKKFVYQRIADNISLDDFEASWSNYKNLNEFPLQDNIFQKQIIDNNTHQIIRYITQYFITKAFKAMKVDLDDPNVHEDISCGNIGTPGRLAKMWVGADLYDSSEILCGRWSHKPRIAFFPNDKNIKLPITKRVSLISCCSHHIAPFSTKMRDDSYAIISYIPEKQILGISKLQRLIDWISKRGWLQEDLTKRIYDEVSEVAKTKNVYVKLYNIVHTCESLRGVQNDEGTFSSEYFDGLFNEESYRNMVK